jgi:hypothetical protein
MHLPDQPPENAKPSEVVKINRSQLTKSPPIPQKTAEK